MTFAYRQAGPGDAGPAETLVALCFGPGRFAKSAYRLREGVRPVSALSHVAEAAGRIVGSIQYWPVAIGSEPALLLGPLAVDPQLQGQGVGMGLMQLSLAAAAAAGWRAAILVGDEPYYARVGFQRLTPGRLTFPGPVDQTRLLGLALAAGALETLAGPVLRPHLDEPQCACGTALAPRTGG
jgi:predicted N-acetyltransferase YhbS